MARRTPGTVRPSTSTARILGVTSNLVLFGESDLQRQNLLAPLIITGSADAFAFEQQRPQP
jgi:hypothetical protein